MALADTANLIVTLKLDDKFSGPLRGASTSLNTFQSNVGTIGKGVGQVGAGVGRVATNLLKLGVVAGAAFGGVVIANLKAGIESVQRLEVVTAATNQVIESTGGVAKQSTDDVRRLAETYEDLNSTIDDKVIQSGENLLLTFPKIGEKAFQPALEAALDLNTALGGGKAGLQTAIIQVGKALQDPIRGVTALRRVGVGLSKEQEEQIKKLVAQNDLYGAQQVILGELAKEFGGQFAAAGDTATAHMARFDDKIEDLQMRFAGPFTGVLDRITVKLADFLSEQGTLDAVGRLGDSIASLFTDEAIDRGIGVLRSGLDLLSPSNLSKIGQGISGAFDFIKRIDFKAIGDALAVTAKVAKTAVDAFLSLPPEVQSVAIAALAANRLSGGLLGSGIGNIGKGLLGLLTGNGLLGRGSSAANPLWVQSVGGIGGGPGGLPLAAGGGALLVALTAGTLAAIGLAFYASQQVPRDPFAHPGDVITPGRGFGRPSEHGTRPGVLNVTDLDTHASLREGLPVLVSEFKKSRATSADLYRLQKSEEARRAAAAAATLDRLRATASAAERAAGDNAQTRRNAEILAARQAESNSKAASMLDRLRAVASATERTAAKDFAPKFVANITNNISARLSVTQSLYQQSLYTQIREG